MQTVKLVDIKQVVKQTYSDTVQYNLSQPINTDIRLNKAQKYKTDTAYYRLRFQLENINITKSRCILFNFFKKKKTPDDYRWMQVSKL